MKKLRDWWQNKLNMRVKNKDLPPISVEHLIKQNAPLTDAEEAFILKTNNCPDCKIGPLLAGPEGGCSMNVKCSNWDCRHEFNITPGLAFGGHRLDRDCPELYGMRKEE